MKATFSKAEKLKSKKLIEEVFAEGHTIKAFPLKLVYLKTVYEDDDIKVKTGVSVGKRTFKKAVDRNRIKRLLREAYRLNKNQLFNNITAQYALMFLYIGNEKPEFAEIDTKMKRLLDMLVTALQS